MNFPSIDIQGSIISAELLGKIRSEQATFQQGKDFKKDFTNAKLKDEISSAWHHAKGQWAIFQSKLGRLKEGDSGTTETRNFWIVPLLSNLGYNLSFSRQAEEINGKSFPIGYRESQLDGFPVYIGGFYESIDKRPENKLLRVSPHALIQEYLNYSEHLYGLVTNGKQLRLLRDASRITRLSYVEFNLQKMMEEDLYSDFVLLYRIIHISRMPHKIESGADSIIEKYHHEGLEAGSTIRSKLGKAVKDTIKALANGFLNHPDNEIVRIALQQGKFNSDEYYRQQLRIIYRLLFLFVIEERNLVYADSKSPETKRFRQIYYDYYSLMRLRKLAKKLPPLDANRHYDLWQSLLNTFALFEKKDIGEKLGIMCLQGDLFGPGSIATSNYDLHDCRLSNALVLNVIKALSYFENETNVQIAVNYGGLGVEEFGSVYEGLLELQLRIEPIAGTNNFSCSYAGSEERSKSGSHYTPDELVHPLIKHSLDYLLEDRKKIISDIIAKQRFFGPVFFTQRQELVNQHIYCLKVCDVACGSGHLLISGARRIAEVAACIIEEEEQPNPKAFQLAKRNAILNCIYGVDKNPLAIELCKVALWLEAYLPGQPLNFLNHHIKCGDAIVGLAHREELENGIADEAFKTLPGDDKDIAKTYRDQNISDRKERATEAIQLKADFEKTTENSVQEAMVDYKFFNQLPESTPIEIEDKTKAYKKFIDGKGYSFLKSMADTQVAQFFIPKTDAKKIYSMTDADFRLIISGYKGWQDRRVAMASVVALEHGFFHWFLEFPEVFNQGGFDCVLGNPPFLGRRKLTGSFGDEYLEYLKHEFFPIGAEDLVTYFFRRIFEILSKNSFLSLISTNTISQGGARESGTDIIESKGGTINHAVSSMKWPGLAAVEVSLVSIFKGRWTKKFYLNTKEVERISTYLDDSSSIKQPLVLKSNLDLSFKGSEPAGMGYILEPSDAIALLGKDQKNSDIIFPYLNGDDLNNSVNQSASRYIINFFDWDEDKAKKYSDCYEIIYKLVKPERQRKIIDKNGNSTDEFQLRYPLPQKWWIYGEKRPKLYSTIKDFEDTIVIARTSKTAAFTMVHTKQVLNANLTIIAFNKYFQFSLLQSTFHVTWAWKYSTKLKTDLIYQPSDVFETFPFPQKLIKDQENKLEQIGDQYHEHRRQLMLSIQLGLTKTYNAFHAKEVLAGITASLLTTINKQAIEKQYGKEVWNLWNHLQKTPGTCSIEEAIAGILKLRELHVQMDNAVLEAYGWQDVALRHDFYEASTFPKTTASATPSIPKPAKKSLKRLLELNHKIHAEEVAAGLWDKKATKPKTYKTQNSESSLAKEKEMGFGDLFD